MVETDMEKMVRDLRNHCIHYCNGPFETCYEMDTRDKACAVCLPLLSLKAIHQERDNSGGPLSMLRDHLTAVIDYGYFIIHPADVLRLIDLAEQGGLKGLKVGL